MPRRRRCECGVESDLQALIWAAAYGHADCARLLIDAGADTEATTDVRVGHHLLVSYPPILFKSPFYSYLLHICSYFPFFLVLYYYPLFEQFLDSSLVIHCLCLLFN
jgi:hypothetical protein